MSGLEKLSPIDEYLLNVQDEKISQSDVMSPRKITEMMYLHGIIALVLHSIPISVLSVGRIASLIHVEIDVVGNIILIEIRGKLS